MQNDIQHLIPGQRSISASNFNKLADIAARRGYSNMTHGFIDRTGFFTRPSPSVDATDASGYLLARYLFNNNLLDSSGNGHNGTAGGGLASTRYIAEFDKVDDDVDCGSDYIGISPLTIIARIRPIDAGEGQLGRIVDNGKVIFRTAVDASRLLTFSSDGSTSVSSAASALTWHKWQDVAVTRTAAGVANIYVNGVLSGAANQASGTPVAGTSNVFIGNNTGGSATFHGGMDDVRIYNKVLAAAEIRRITDERAMIYSHANEVWGSLTVFQVQHAATAGGDGIYDCYEQNLDATDWASTDGTEKIANLNTTEVEVLNLAEHDTEATYVAHLAANDLIIAFRRWDDEGNARWAGVPLRQANADRPRIAYCSAAAGAAQTIAATLDHTTGTAITVTCFSAQGNTANLNVCIPRLADNDPIMVTKIGGTWYCLTTFQPSEDCVCG